MRVDQDILAVLDRAIVSGSTLTLTGQLDRKLYERTAKAIEAAGGKWSRKAKAHVFDGDAAAAIEPIILTGEIVSAKQELGAFYTPPKVARLVIALANLGPGLSVLEPSAGRGALAAPAHLAGCRVDCVEIDPRSVAILCSTPYDCVVEADFLAQRPEPLYDRVVMNPPFARQDDIRHVMHAFRFLKPGGRLVAVMSSSVRFRTDRLTTEFRSFVEASPHGAISDNLPEGSFKESGTAVNACIVSFNAASRP